MVSLLTVRIVAVAALAGALLVGAYQLGRTTMKGEHDAEALGKKAGEEAALQAAARAIAKIEVKSEKHIHPLLKEVRTNTVYRECKHTPDSVLHLNSLITGQEFGGTGLSTAVQAPR